DAGAGHLTSTVFRVLTLGLISGTISTPLVRMLQISDRVLSTGLINLITSVLVASLNLFFIFKLKWDVLGIAYTSIAASFFYVLIELIILAKAGIQLELFRLAKYLLWAVASSLLAAWLLRGLPVFPHELMTTGVHGVCFGAFIAIAYWPVRSN